VATHEDFLQDGKWICTKCGACCRLAGVAIPELDRGDDVCRHLTEENLCGIYEKRPILCRRIVQGSDNELAGACAEVFDLVYGASSSLESGLSDSGLDLLVPKATC